ncbi:MAG: nucleotide exchange factor GrpE [Rhodospirillales bacterium]|nr:nucleotide exchange factor GrpE [Alphaproteobacteria bacterium]MBL6928810.1 nucleotide exchange factor GrpE [Rhodospirillales bacterium]
MAKKSTKDLEETSETEAEEIIEQPQNPWNNVTATAPGDEDSNKDDDEAEAEEEDAGPDALLRVAELENEAAELKDKLLRALAETENVRRRALRDRQDATKYGIANFAREMLGVADNLRRALDHVDADARKDVEAIENLAAGVEMTERAMLDAMERFGVKPIEALGEKFDHNFHEAMFEAPDPTKPSGTVIQELEKGYVLADRLLRPARVGVSSGGPAAVAEEPAEPTDEKADETAAAKDQRAAYEKQSDAQGESGDGKGGKLDEEL